MRTAVVTGASRGLGVAIAAMLAEEGCALVLGARSLDELEQVAVRLRDDHDVPVEAVACDVTVTTDLVALRDRAEQTTGRVDVLVANAGIGDFAPIVDTDEDVFRRLLDVNVLGLWRTLQVFTAPLQAAPTRGLAVVVSSDVSARVFPGGGPYVASKHAARALARTYQQEHPHLRVTELRPGSTRTAFAGADADAAPEPGMLTADEVADALRVAVTAPDDVRLEEIVVRSAGQAPAY